MAIDVPRNPWDIAIEDNVAIDAGTVLLSSGRRSRAPRIRIGAGTYCNRFVFIDASLDIAIGENCMIGPFCYITDHDHGTAPNRTVASQELVSAPVHVGANVWIGAAATVLKGVTLGEGCVVGAGAVVTRDVEPGQIVAGTPARLLRRSC